MSDYAEHDQRDPYAETRPVADPAGPADSAGASLDHAAIPVVPDAESLPRFEAAPESGGGASPQSASPANQDAGMLGSFGSFGSFRARRAQERAQREPFPRQYAGEAATPLEYTQVTPPPFEPVPIAPVPVAPRRRLRPAFVVGGILALVVGLGAGVWAATGSSAGSSAGSSSPAAAGAPSASAPASPGSKPAKGGRVITARLTVTSIGTDSFTATNARGETLVVQLTPATRFGTAKRPFDRSQLVPGAVVTARLRDASGGTAVATVIVAAVASPKGAPSTSASADGTA